MIFFNKRPVANVPAFCLERPKVYFRICFAFAFFVNKNCAMINILLLGAGGREHALAWKMSKSQDCGSLYIAPGNAGTAKLGENVSLNNSDFEVIKDFVLTKDIQMVVVGPEQPLVEGI